MSRIEEAMEKAGKMREKTGPAGGAGSEKKTSLLHQKPAVNIEIANPKLVAATDYNLPVAEEYRKLRSAVIELTDRERLLNTLMVTSSVGGEGKSLTSLNLSLSLAQGYDQRVVLVDTDLRNPSICRYLGITPGPGLVDCLLDNADLDDILVNTGLGSLLLLPAGREVVNPVEVLSSKKMKEFVENIKQRFAGYYIIFDTSPVLPFAEARVIGNMVDGVIFVVKEGGTSFKNIQDALEALKGSNIIGTVYNKATTAGLAGGYHYYYYDYDYRRRETEPPASGQKTGLLSRLRRRRDR